MCTFFRCFFILDTSAPPFDLNLSLYQQQLKKDLVMNVYSEGKWGSYQHLPLDSPAPITAPHAWVKIMTLGDLSSFKWLEGNLNPDRLWSNTGIPRGWVWGVQTPPPRNYSEVLTKPNQIPSSVENTS
jgi:hypothetical protein